MELEKCKIACIFSLKINALIYLLEQAFIYSTQLLIKVPVFKFNICFVFHRISGVAIHWVLEFLQIILDFLGSENTVRLSIYLCPLFRFAQSHHSRVVSNLCIEEKIRFPCNPGYCGHKYQTKKSDCVFSKLKHNLRLKF